MERYSKAWTGEQHSAFGGAISRAVELKSRRWRHGDSCCRAAPHIAIGMIQVYCCKIRSEYLASESPRLGYIESFREKNAM